MGPAFIAATPLTRQCTTNSTIPHNHRQHFCSPVSFSLSKTSPRLLRRPVRITIYASSSPEANNGAPRDLESSLRRRTSGGPGAADRALFGIRLQTNGDVIKFGLAAVTAGYLLKSLLQLAGMPDLLAGQVTTAMFAVAMLVGWVSTYLFRVGTKGMTYAQQLRDYEDAVIKKRYEELSEEELAALAEEMEDEE